MKNTSNKSWHKTETEQEVLQSQWIRVYIAKNTFTTLIDHFTSVCHRALVYSNQLIKLSF
ncbi:hypothetical protein EVA_13406 [gut metagenome]|uniref:Uncharacterized protein n=1 Tax=gut metagenome TaxID=749906 RepID=J9FVE5_9ZZZZ